MRRLQEDGRSLGRALSALAGHPTFGPADLIPNIGTATNNRAEYLALIEGLRAAQEWKPDRLEVFMDSKLVVEQLAGRYRIKNKDLQPLVRNAQELLASFPEVVIAHVERARNKGADALANRAIDEYRAK